ncbi:MAG TPA: PH domain-containing protein [Gemmatimonadales bacterium]|nr:PH domain-containing protein [Gemmatimonadales bacterium]
MSPLTYFISAIVILTIVSWLQADARRPPPATSPDGSVELRHGTRYLILAVACLLVGPAIMMAPVLVATGWTSYDIVAFVVLALAFASFGIWMVLDARKTRVVLSSEGVRASTPFGGERFLKWSDIQTVGYNLFGPWLVLKGSGLAPIRVHRRLVGSGFFLQRLRAQVRPDAFRGLARLFLPLSKDAA